MFSSFLVFCLIFYLYIYLFLSDKAILRQTFSLYLVLSVSLSSHFILLKFLSICFILFSLSTSSPCLFFIFSLPFFFVSSSARLDKTLSRQTSFILSHSFSAFSFISFYSLHSLFEYSFIAFCLPCFLLASSLFSLFHFFRFFPARLDMTLSCQLPLYSITFSVFLSYFILPNYLFFFFTFFVFSSPPCPFSSFSHFLFSFPIRPPLLRHPGLYGEDLSPIT